MKTFILPNFRDGDIMATFVDRVEKKVQTLFRITCQSEVLISVIYK